MQCTFQLVQGTQKYAVSPEILHIVLADVF